MQDDGGTAVALCPADPDFLITRRRNIHLINDILFSLQLQGNLRGLFGDTGRQPHFLMENLAFVRAEDLQQDRDFRALVRLSDPVPEGNAANNSSVAAEDRAAAIPCGQVRVMHIRVVLQPAVRVDFKSIRVPRSRKQQKQNGNKKEPEPHCFFQNAHVSEN